jgi:hypothetical protein
MKTVSLAALMGLALLAQTTANAQQPHRPTGGEHPTVHHAQYPKGPTHVSMCPRGTSPHYVCVQWGPSTSGPFKACVKHGWRCQRPYVNPN